MKVGILIPTLNRLNFIKRTIMYYNSLKSKHHIYIGDASEDEVSRKTISFLKGIKNVCVRYFHWKGLGGSETILKLAEEASDEIDYCAYSGDDDYFIESSLAECAEFLSKNPDYRTAQGRAALVTMDKPEPVCAIKGIGQYWGENYIESSNRYERFCHFSKNYYVLQYSVHRVNEFIHDSLDFISIKDASFEEYTHCFTFAISGKSKFLDCLYLVRVRHPEMIISSEKSIFERISSPSWSADYKTTVDSLSSKLSEDDDMTFLEAKKIIVEIMRERFNTTLIEQYDKKGSLRQGLSNIFNNNISDSIKKIIKSNRFFIRMHNINEMELLKTKSSRFYLDFIPVEQSLTGKINCVR